MEQQGFQKGSDMRSYCQCFLYSVSILLVTIMTIMIMTTIIIIVTHMILAAITVIANIAFIWVSWLFKHLQGFPQASGLWM